MTSPALPDRPRWRRVWAQAWRLITVIVLGLLAFTIVMGAGLEGIPLDSPNAARVSARLLIDVVVGAVIIVLYALRHRLPVFAPYLGIALAAFSTLGSAAAAALVVSVAARRHAVHITLTSALFIAVSTVDITVYPFPDETPLWQLLLVAVVVTGVLVLFGLLIGSRRQLRQEQRDRIAATEVAQRAQIEQARAGERTRIAREMHDVLGHRLSLMAVHAGALEYRADLTAAQRAEAAGVLRENSRLALDELRQVLGVLRSDEQVPGTAASAPQPTASDLPALIDEARAAGASIEVHALQLEGIPTGTGRQLFRITQELLTNARRHAPGRSTALRLERDAAGIRLLVRNRHDGTERTVFGHGLTGIAERVRLAGGSLDIDDADGRFEVRVVLPCPMS